MDGMKPLDPESGYTEIARSDPELLNSQLSVESTAKDTYRDFASKNINVHKSLHHRSYSKRVRRRLVYKNGECNISNANIKKLKRRFLADIFTTLVDIKWRWSLLLFVLAFVVSWLFFALIWWLICFAHGDFEPANQNQDFKPCVLEVDGFTSALLFSIETQHTIGYGSRQTTPECPEAVLVMMVQSCFGVIIQALMTGLVFAKLSRPKKRAETLMFSKNAVICQRNGTYVVLFRVGDMRKSHIVEAHVRGLLVKKMATKEGEVNPLEYTDIDIGFNEGRDRLFLVWPLIIEHKIDEESPFWEMSYEDLQRENFELIVILEGIVESTGMTTQARSSYLPGEMLWGHQFERLVTFQKDDGEYQVDYSRFHSTLPVTMPPCSAKAFTRMKEFSSQQTLDSNFEDHLFGSHGNNTPSSSPYVLKRNFSVQTTKSQQQNGKVSMGNGDIPKRLSIKKPSNDQNDDVGSDSPTSGFGSGTALNKDYGMP